MTLTTTLPLNFVLCSNTRVYNLHFGPHINHFLVVAAEKIEKFRANFFVLHQISEQTQLANSRWQQRSYFTSFLNNFIIIDFWIGIILRLNCYQQPNKALENLRKLNQENFLQMQYGFHIQVHALQIHYCLLEKHLPKTQVWYAAVWSIKVKGYQSFMLEWSCSSRFAFIVMRISK